MVMFVFIMAVFVMMFMFIVIMMVPMVVAAAAFFSVLMVMVMMMLVLFLLGRFGREGGELGLEGAPLLHRFEDLPARQLVPRGGDQGRLVVVLPDEGDGRLEFCVVHPLGPGEDDGGGVFDLVVVELAEVLHIHFDLGRVGDGGEAAQHRAGGVSRLDRPDDVGELADAGGLDEDPVGVVLFNDLVEGFREVADQRAADAAGVHLVDLDAGILKETAVDADFAEFVLNQHQLLALVSVGDQLFDEGGLAGPEEAGENVDGGHGKQLPFSIDKKHGLQCRRGNTPYPTL